VEAAKSGNQPGGEGEKAIKDKGGKGDGKVFVSMLEEKKKIAETVCLRGRNVWQNINKFPTGGDRKRVKRGCENGYPNFALTIATNTRFRCKKGPGVEMSLAGKVK